MDVHAYSEGLLKGAQGNMDVLPTNIHTKEDLYDFLDKLPYNPTFSDVVYYELTRHYHNKPPTDHQLVEQMMNILKVRYHDYDQAKLTKMYHTFKTTTFDKRVQFTHRIDWTKITNEYRQKSTPTWDIKHQEFLRQIYQGFVESKKKNQLQPPPLPESEIPQFVAQGSYGCVHRPSLFCNPPHHPDYTGKVSKVMTTKNMNQELKEYVLIARADPKNNFYLGKPETCPLGINPINRPPIEKCKMGKDIVQKPQDYSLILMKDGGTNWDEFADRMSHLPVNRQNTERMETFWVEARRMIYGVKAFIAHGIMHHDLKAQNIVYNEPTGRSNFIDFGLMEDIRETEAACSHNQYKFAVYHWSYPFETSLLNKPQFNQFAKASRAVRNTFITDFVKGYNDPKNKRGDFVRTFFREAGIQNKADRNELLRMYQTFVMDKVPNVRYKDFLDVYFSKMDVYGLGLSMMYVLTRTQKFTPEFAEKALPLFFYTLSPDPFMRYSIDQLLQEYDRILVDTGLAKKYKIPGLHQQSPEVSIEKLAKPDGKVAKSVGSKNKHDDIIAELDPTPVPVKSTTTKFSNMAISTPSPIVDSSKRIRKSSTTQMDVVDSRTIYPESSLGEPMNVVDASLSGQPKGAQVQMNVVKSIYSNKNPKVCPNGMEPNRATGRCQTRKACPTGMKLNPVTNRCNKTNKAWSV